MPASPPVSDRGGVVGSICISTDGEGVASRRCGVPGSACTGMGAKAVEPDSNASSPSASAQSMLMPSSVLVVANDGVSTFKALARHCSTASNNIVSDLSLRRKEEYSLKHFLRNFPNKGTTNFLYSKRSLCPKFDFTSPKVVPECTLDTNQFKLQSGRRGKTNLMMLSLPPSAGSGPPTINVGYIPVYC